MGIFSSPEWDVDDAGDTCNKKLFGYNFTKLKKKLGKKNVKKNKLKNDTKTTDNFVSTEVKSGQVLNTHTSAKKLLRRHKQKERKACANSNLQSNVSAKNIPVSPSTKHLKKERKENKSLHKVRDVKVNDALVKDSKSHPINYSYNKSPSEIISARSPRKRKFSFTENNEPSVTGNSAKRKKTSVYCKSPVNPIPSKSNCGTLKSKERKSESKKLKKKQQENKINPTIESLKEEQTTPNHEYLKLQNESVHSKYLSKLKHYIENQQKHTTATHVEKRKKMKCQPMNLREQMMQRLQASRFRYLNEQMYNSDSRTAQLYFQNDPDAFQSYHEGYQKQVARWPLNPLDKIINSILKKPTTFVVADFGCGDAKLSRSVPNTVHSFDLVALCPEVTACDMAHTPLDAGSIDIAVFCLSLMGTNLSSYLIEANRVLKQGGILKIAEVESRFENVDSFIEVVNKYGFSTVLKDLSHNLFYFMDFKKQRSVKKSKKLPHLNLKPCLYKKR